MQQKDAFDELRKAKEEEYFHKKERELLEKLRQRSALEAERKGMAAALQSEDPQLLEDLRELGYTAATVKLLFAVPLIQVAWASGSVDEKERALILELARADDGPSRSQLTAWLDRRPPEEFFSRSLRIIGSLIGGAGEAKQDLLSSCLRIAQASGGILGLGSVSSGERDTLERVAREIEKSHSAKTREVLDKL
jgi:hypothetical protein